MPNYIPPNFPNAYSDIEIVDLPDFDFQLMGDTYRQGRKQLNASQVSYLKSYISEFLAGEITTSNYYTCSYNRETGGRIINRFDFYETSDESSSFVEFEFVSDELFNDGKTYLNFINKTSSFKVIKWFAPQFDSKLNYIFEPLRQEDYYKILYYKFGSYWLGRNGNEEILPIAHRYVRNFSVPTDTIIPEQSTNLKVSDFPDKFYSVNSVSFPAPNYGEFGFIDTNFSQHELTSSQASYLKKYLSAFISGDIPTGTKYLYGFEYYHENPEENRIWLILQDDNGNDVLGICSEASGRTTIGDVDKQNHFSTNHATYTNFTNFGLSFKKKGYNGSDSIGGDISYSTYNYNDTSRKYEKASNHDTNLLGATAYCVSFVGVEPLENCRLSFTLSLTGMGNDPCKRCCSCEIEDKKYKTVIEFTSDEPLKDRVFIDPADLEYEWQDNTLTVMLAEGETVTVDNIPVGVKYEINVESDDPCDENEYNIDNASGTIGENEEGEPQEETEVKIEAQNGETVEQYLERLRQRGYEKLAESLKLENVEFTLQDERIKLGDLVTVDLPEFGFKAVVRVTGVKLKSQDNQTIRTISVGTPLKILRKARI